MAKYTPMSPQAFQVFLDRMKAERAAEKGRLTEWEEDERKRQASDDFLRRVEAARRQKVDALRNQRDQVTLTRTAPLADAWEI